MKMAEPVVRTVELTEVQRDLSPLARDVASKTLRVIVEESGIPVAALVSLDDLHQLEQFRRDRETRYAVIDRMRAAFADVPADEVEREIAKAVAEVRREMEAERTAAGEAE